MKSMSELSSSIAGGFWTIENDDAGQGAQFESVGETWQALSDYGYASDLMDGKRMPVRPLTFRQVRKSRFYDLLSSGTPHIIPVSDRLLDILQSEGATGWKTFPLVLVDLKGRAVPGYRGLAITGKAGPPLWERSQRFIAEPEESWSPRLRMLRGIWFDEGTWDGSDLFTLKGTCFLLATDRIVRAMRKARLKGIEWSRQSEVEILESAVK